MMFCTKCGKQIDNDSTFCPFCGRQVNEPVVNTKSTVDVGYTTPVKEGISSQAKKWIIGVIAGLAAVTGVTIGAVRLIGGSDDKEPVVAEVDEIEPVVAETPVEEPAPVEEPVSEEPVDDSLHTVSKYEISNILQEFFQAHLGCYVSYCYGNCRTVPKDVSSMQEHVLGPVSTIELARMLVSDYDDSLFFMEISTTDIYCETSRNDRVSYRCIVTIEDINIYGDTFTYYEGTDAEIAVVARLDYYVNDKLMNISNNYASCLLDNSTSNPDKWLIAAAIFTNQSAYEKSGGNIFKRMLVDENIDSSVAESIKNTEWKQRYLEMPSETIFKWLNDLTGDGIPELWICDDSLGENSIFYYMKPDGTIEEITEIIAYSGNRLRCSFGRQGYYGDVIYEYNSSIGEYEIIFDGAYETENFETYTYTINNVECSEEEYNLKADALLNYSNATYFLDEAVSDKSLRDCIFEY